MPLLDVSEVLADPDFADTFTLIRRTQTVGVDGRAATVEVPFAAAGVVQPASAQMLRLLPEGARVEGAIQVHTVERLHLAINGRAADVVVWNGRRYTVAQLSDYGYFGIGYTAAVCTLLDLLSAP